MARKDGDSKNVHVTPHKDGGWQVKKEGADRASAKAETKKEAVDIGRGVAKREQSELVVHGKDGRIQQKDSHGNDPRNVKG